MLQHITKKNLNKKLIISMKTRALKLVTCLLLLMLFFNCKKEEKKSLQKQFLMRLMLQILASIFQTHLPKTIV